MRTDVRRALVAALGTGLLAAGLAPAPTAAATPPAEIRVPLTTLPSPTEIVAASGRSILGWAYGTYQLSNDFGSTWRRITPGLYSDASTPDFAGDGVAAFTIADQAKIVDLASGVTRTVDFSGVSVDVGDYSGPVVATSDRHAIVRDGDAVKLSAYSDDLVAAAPSAIQLDPLPAAGDYAEDDWRVDHLFGYRVRGFGYGRVTDVDLFNLDGTAGPAPFRVPGAAYALAASDSTHLQYLYRTSKSIQRCTRDLVAGASSCHSVLAVPKGSWTHAERQGDAIVVSVYGSYWYLCSEAGGAPCVMRRVSAPKDTWIDNRHGTIGDPVEPLFLAGRDDLDSIYSWTSAGSLVKRSGPLRAPRIPQELALSAGQLLGVDWRDSATAWRRPVTPGAIGAETVLSTSVDTDTNPSIAASAGRAALLTGAGVTLYDRGRKTGTIKKADGLYGLSGPYPSVSRGASRYVGAPLTTLRRADDVMSVDGTRLLRVSESGLVITDIVDATVQQPVLMPPVPTDDHHYLLGLQLKGEWVVASYLGFVLTEESFTFELTTRLLGLADPDATWSDTVAGMPVAFGDGFAALAGSDQATSGVAVWNFATGEFTAIEDPDLRGAVAADGNRIVYATDTELVLREIPGVEPSAPRVLGVVAPSSCNAWKCAWTPEIDATLPLAAGVLRIVDATGATVRTLHTAAAGDGSVRGATWDGKEDDGSFAPAGRYSWVLETDAADGSGPLVASDGTSAAGGVLDVTRTFVGKAKVAALKVSDTSPHVGDVLTATATAVPSDASVTYAWYAGSARRVPAPDGSYAVTAADLGKKISVVATAARDGYSAASKRSSSTKAVGRGTFSGGEIELSGTAAFPGELTATPGSWRPEPASVAYQWYRVVAGRPVAIPDATAATYPLRAEDVGFVLEVVAKATAPGFTDGVQRLRTPVVEAQ